MSHTLDWIATKAGRPVGRLLSPIIWLVFHPKSLVFYGGVVSGIVGTIYGPGLHNQYAPWAPYPDATTEHVWVGMPVQSRDGLKVGTVHSVFATKSLRGESKTIPPASIYVKEWRYYALPQTRNLRPSVYKYDDKNKRIVLSQNADAHRAKPAESWRPHWWSDQYWPPKNYWPGNWTWGKWPW